jgi:signal-transduction protein with cAMP-binding, CBS, and nucleotidyltransferase domain
MTNLYPVSKRKPKTSLEKSVAATITMSPLKLNKHKEFSKSIGESLSEFYRVAADIRMKKEKTKIKHD